LLEHTLNTSLIRCKKNSYLATAEKIFRAIFFSGCACKFAASDSTWRDSAKLHGFFHIALFSFEPDGIHDLLQVAPDGLSILDGVAAEQKSGVEGGHELDAAPLAPLAAESAHGGIAAEHVLGGGEAEGDDDFGADELDLAHEIRRAGFDFIGRGGAIAGGAAFDDVGDVNLLALEAHGGDHLVEELASAADEWAAGLVLGLAGAFADEENRGIDIALAENGLGAGLGEAALGADSHLLFFKLGQEAGFFFAGEGREGREGQGGAVLGSSVKLDGGGVGELTQRDGDFCRRLGRRSGFCGRWGRYLGFLRGGFAFAKGQGLLAECLFTAKPQSSSGAGGGIYRHSAHGRNKFRMGKGGELAI
jgi:hypothetical protein